MSVCTLTRDPDPEDIGPVIPDPWDDDEQADWPNNREEDADARIDKEPREASD